jgi:hypothetical protein
MAEHVENLHPSGPPAPVPAPRTGISPLGGLLAGLWLVLAAAALLAGLDYYRMPSIERAYSAERELFAPVGVVGHSYGYIGTLMVIVGVGGYVARKRMGPLSGLGRLSTWLQVHIFLCTLGPYLVLLHTSFRFGGIAAISFWSMAVAVASGVVGRYLYVHIPRTLNGQARTLRSVEADRAETARRLAEAGGASLPALEAALGAPAPPSATLRAAIGRAALAGHRRRAALRRLRRAIGSGATAPERRRLLDLAEARLRTEQQIAVLVPFQRMFRYWHVLHLPIALVMFATLAVHVAVAVLFGYGWPF